MAESATLALDAKVQELRRKGAGIVDFGAGQPDFPTPDPVKEAGKRAIRENRTKYTPAAGLPEARKAVAHHLHEGFGTAYDAGREVLVTNGAKQAIFNAVQCLADAGDEILFPSPYWVSYPEQVRSCGAVPVVVPTEDTDFRLDAKRLEDAITDRTRAIILNSPSNPTGAVYTRGELEAVAALAEKHDLVVIADEIYGRMVYDADFVSFGALGEAARARTIVIGAVSKTYSMTGWRFGWAAGPSELIGPMSRLQSHSTSNACTVSQYAAIEALTGDQSETARRVEEFDRRRRHMLDRLAKIDGFDCIKPDGAFFVFPRIEGLFGSQVDGSAIDGSLAFAEAVLERASVAIVPGLAFGSDAFVRISYAVSIDEIDRGVDRLAEFVGTLRCTS